MTPDATLAVGGLAWALATGALLLVAAASAAATSGMVSVEWGPAEATDPGGPDDLALRVRFSEARVARREGALGLQVTVDATLAPPSRKWASHLPVELGVRLEVDRRGREVEPVGASVDAYAREATGEVAFRAFLPLGDLRRHRGPDGMLHGTLALAFGWAGRGPALERRRLFQAWVPPPKAAGEEAQVVRILAAGAGADARCGICGDALAEAPQACPACGAPHHDDCWRFNEDCSTYGCGTWA